MNWQHCLRIAREECRAVLTALPPPVHIKTHAVPVVFERRPSPNLIRDGLDPDVLGLFVGDDVAHEGGDPLPPEIVLFLENILEEAAGDETMFRDEVRRTLLHELGHYLGLDESQLWERDLD